MSDGRFTLFGKEPEAIAAPSSIAEAQEIVRQAQGRAIVPWGGGTRQHIGYPPERYDLALSTQNIDCIVDYAPADLTVTVQAGMTLGRLQETLARHGQCLPVDIASPERQTVGGIVAARADSLRRFGFGSVRDGLIGVSVINARGELVKGGGKVVKNVAGYDLPKLYCGSWGTLGLIVEASFKVAAVPQTSATVAVPLDANQNSEDALDSILGSDLQPSFVVLLNPDAAKGILEADGDAQYLIVGFDGPTEAVEWQVNALGGVEGRLNAGAEREARTRLRDFSLLDAPLTAAFHILSSQVGAFARMVEWTARRLGFSAQVMADAALGLMTAHFAPQSDLADWQGFYKDLKDKADRCGGSFIVERMPDVLRDLDVPVWSPLLPDFVLMARLKQNLDPQRLWNPGRFMGRL